MFCTEIGTGGFVAAMVLWSLASAFSVSRAQDLFHPLYRRLPGLRVRARREVRLGGTFRDNQSSGFVQFSSQMFRICCDCAAWRIGGGISCAAC